MRAGPVSCSSVSLMPHWKRAWERPKNEKKKKMTEQLGKISLMGVQDPAEVHKELPTSVWDGQVREGFLEEAWAR